MNISYKIIFTFLVSKYGFIKTDIRTFCIFNNYFRGMKP